MARRSPLNARYQKNTGPAGKTRRSASAAKPKREAGGQAPATAKKKADRPSLRQAFASQPQTPEMKQWRRVWWILIVGAFALAITAGFVPFVQQQPVLRIGVMVAYLVALGGALYIDLGVIRKMRAKADASGKSDKKK